MMSRRKKEKYIHRWLREHPQVRLYLSRDEYELLKKLASEKGVSIKEFILSIIKDLNKVFNEGFREGLRMGYEGAYEELLEDGRIFELSNEEHKKYGLEYPRCPYCGEPLYGVLVDPEANLGAWVLELIILSFS